MVPSPYSVLETVDMAPFVIPDITLIPPAHLGFRPFELEDFRTKRIQYLITLRTFFKSSASVLPNAASITLPILFER